MSTRLRRVAKAKARVGACGVGVVTALAVAGCGMGGGDATTASPAGASHDSGTAAAAQRDGGTGSSSPVKEQSTARASQPAQSQQPASPERNSHNPPRCHASELDVRIGHRGVATGQSHTDVILTNTSDHTCDLYGYPGVSVLDENKNQLGDPAERVAATESRRVALAPDGSASFTVVAGTGSGTGQCRPASSFLRVYPPNAYDPLDTELELRVCDHLFRTTTVAPGTDGSHP